VKLQAGHFYKSRRGDVWCCYYVDPRCEATQAQAYCVHAIATIGFTDARTECFFLDGRYDSDGKREHTLIAECSPTGEPVRA
jgi:hypothetical protein